MSQFVLAPYSIKNLETLTRSGRQASEDLVQLVKDFIRITPIDFGVMSNGAYRTAEEQKALFDKVPKVTECDGYGSKSMHQHGLAVDLVPWVKNNWTWEPKICFALMAAFTTFCRTKGFELTRGGDWNGDGDISDGWDPCHFEIEE